MSGEPRIARIAALATYPIKGCRGIALETAGVAATGLAWDRHWMVVNAHGRFVTQRTHPGLATVVPALTDGALRVTAPGLPPLKIVLADIGMRRQVVVWGDTCEATDEGEHAADWFEHVLGEPARLVRATPRMRRADPDWAGSVAAPLGFPDGFPLLVTNTASLDWLNEQLPAVVPMERFRPNVVIDGLEAFAEDRIHELACGEVRLRLVKPCTRCVVPSVDQLTGVRGADPVAVLRATRFDRGLQGITFGENAVIVAGAGHVLRTGSPVSVAWDS